MKIVPYISNNSQYSRREAEELVRNGFVYINGKKAEVYQEVQDIDVVRVKDKQIDTAPKKIFLVYKPTGYISTTDDEHNRKTVLNLVPKQKVRLHTVGRLDKDSRGLMILTNDGDLTNLYTHPSHQTKKVYRVTLDQHIKKRDKERLIKGIKLKEGIAKADDVKVMANNVLEITLHEGRNREIRRMLGKLGYRVDDLERIKLGEYSLSDLKGRGWIEI